MSDDEIDDIDADLFHWTEPPLPPEERKRNAVGLCCSFMRNLAFHRAGMQPEVQRKLLASTHPQGAFWREAHANFIDISVLEWCKLFVDRNEGKRRKRERRKAEPCWGEHHWRRVVAEPNRFEAELCTTLGVPAAEFDDLIAKVKGYRDGFVAHRDEERIARLPMLELAKKAVAFLHKRLAQEASQGDWQHRGLPTTSEHLDRGFTQAFQEAQSVYAEALARHSQ